MARRGYSKRGCSNYLTQRLGHRQSSEGKHSKIFRINLSTAPQLIGRLLGGTPLCSSPHLCRTRRYLKAVKGKPNGSRPSVTDNPTDVGRLQTRNSEDAFGRRHPG